VEPAPQGKPDPASFGELHIPEGLDAADQRLGVFRSMVTERGIPVAHAQELLELHAEAIRAQEEAHQEALAQRVVNELAMWKNRAMSDTEIGGEALKPTLAVAHQVLAEFGTTALEDMLSRSHMGSHPEVIRLLARFGKAYVAARSRG
jgi:hypothetical protein